MTSPNNSWSIPSDNESTEWELINDCSSSLNSHTSNNASSDEVGTLREKLKEANLRADIAEANLAEARLELNRQNNELDNAVSSKNLLENQIATLQTRVRHLQLQLEDSRKQQSLLQLLNLDEIVGSRQGRRMALRENQERLKKNLKQNQRCIRHQQKQVGKAKKQLRHPMNVPSRHSSAKRVQYWN